MKDRNYKVNIKDIYVGNLLYGINPSKIVTASRVCCLEERLKKRFMSNRTYLLDKMQKHLEYNGDGFCGVSDYAFSRNMLFTLDQEKHADDLLFDTPHYPVLNISSDEECRKSTILIATATYELYELLKYFGYSEKLGYDDILRIRNTFFNCDYVLDNSSMYGREETEMYSSPLSVFDSHGYCRGFNRPIEDSIFPESYFFMLLHNKDCFIADYSRKVEDNAPYFGEVVDRFKPREEEGIVKSLGTMKKTK